MVFNIRGRNDAKQDICITSMYFPTKYSLTAKGKKVTLQWKNYLNHHNQVILVNIISMRHIDIMHMDILH